MFSFAFFFGAFLSLFLCQASLAGSLNLTALCCGVTTLTHRGCGWGVRQLSPRGRRQEKDGKQKGVVLS